MAIFYPLCSSSKGNCTYIGTEKNAIIIDAGISARRLLKLMAEQQLDTNSIRAIFITHEHSDHVKGLSQIVKILKVPVFGTYKTLKQLIANKHLSENDELFEVNTSDCITEFDMQIEAFNTPHDSEHSVGYKILTTDNKKIGYSTDLGHITNEVLFGLNECDFTFIESNYDEGMLHNGGYPLFLKKRIDGIYGHLSNDDCSQAIEKLIKLSNKKFMLAHLSENNNHPLIALNHTVNYLETQSIKQNVDYEIDVALSKENKKIIL